MVNVLKTTIIEIYCTHFECTVWLVLANIYTCVNHYHMKTKNETPSSSEVPCAPFQPLSILHTLCHATTDGLSIQIRFDFLEVHVNVTILHMFFSVQLLWLSIICNSPRCVLKSFYCWVEFHCVSILQFVYSTSISWHLFCGEREYIGKEAW